jgi:hypothetical protein
MPAMTEDTGAALQRLSTELAAARSLVEEALGTAEEALQELQAVRRELLRVDLERANYRTMLALLMIQAPEEEPPP